MVEAKQREALVGFVGGKGNIASELDLDDVYAITVKDQGLVDLASIKNLDFVASASCKAGMVRIVTGTKEEQDMAGKYHELAGDILKNVGGIDNVNSLTHCITRLRFKLKDEGVANKEALEGLDGVIQVMQAGGQYQVVVGSKVDDVYKELLNEYKVPGLGEVAADDGDAAAADGGKKENLFSKLMSTISGTMGPILMPLAAAGMIKGLIAMANAFGWVDATSATYLIWYAIGDGFFYFLPIILGYTAAKKFGGNELIGMGIGAALVYPSMVSLGSADPLGTVFAGTPFAMDYVATFFGIPLIYPASGYTSSVIPIILATWVASKLERALKNGLPELVRNFLTPVIVFAVMGPATYLVIGPLAGAISDILTMIASGIYNLPVVGSALLGFVVGGSWSTLVMFGLHWALVPIFLTNFSTLGFDPVGATTLLGGFIGVGQGIGVILRTKSDRTRGIAIPATVSQVCGIGEPLLYGIQVPSKFLLYQNICLAALGGLTMGILNVVRYVNGGLGIFAFTSYINTANGDVRNMVLCIAICVVGVIAGLVLTMLTYHDDGCYIGKKKAAE